MTPAERKNELILLPVLKAHRGPRGGLVMTKKYFDGAAQYAQAWPGPVTTLAEVSPTPSTDLDHVELLPGEGETGLEPRPPDPEALAARAGSAALVFGFLAGYERVPTRLMARLGVPVVHGCEYTRRTEWQIIDAGDGNPVVKLRRKYWIWQEDRIRRRMIPALAGLQCNGLPVYEAYRGLRPDALLYFDNRVRADEVISDGDLEARAARLREGRPLELVFGGRFVPMKGALFLPEVARALRARGVPFRFRIFGGGPQEGELRAAIARHGLGDVVTLHAPVDFRTEWTPMLKRAADLFVCCHPQGDPSSVYTEVMSCGVPLAGFDNEAFAGVAATAGAGFPSPLGDAEALAGLIADLHGDRERLVRAARRGRDFAAEHSFERTFARRTEHLIACSRLGRDGRG